MFSDSDFIEYLNNQSEIEYIEKNHKYSVRPIQSNQRRKEDNTNEEPILSNSQKNYKRQLRVEKAPNWGLARISQRKITNINEYTYEEMGG
ncbi:hypothetical protein BD560DRAFT_382851 [Blakeslea trispora]|nr:hypothetical protein BD560DRAFT_382851 [Blakeslea trispora]